MMNCRSLMRAPFLTPIALLAILALPPLAGAGPVGSGTIIITALVDAEVDDAIEFSTIAPLDPNVFSLDGGALRRFDDVAGGTYPITVNPPPSLGLTRIDCDDDDSETASTADLAAGVARVELGDGESVACEFYFAGETRADNCEREPNERGVLVDLPRLTAARPGFTIVNEFCEPTGSEVTPLGDLLFSTDGEMAYLLSDSEDDGAFVAVSTVTRDADGNVTAFSPFDPVFEDPGTDTGLAFAPGGDSLFYRTYIDSGEGEITQRFPDGMRFSTPISAYDGTYGGLAFVPEPFGNAGQLITASYDDGELWLHPAVEGAGGIYTIGAPVRLLTGTGDIGDLEYGVGPLSGWLFAAGYDDVDFSLYALAVDPQSGLPDPDPTYIPIATGSDEAWGVAVDPVTGNLWVIDYGDVMTQVSFTDGIFRNDFESDPVPGE